MKIDYIKGNKILILGLGISGAHVVTILKHNLNEFYIVDDHKADDFNIFKSEYILENLPEIDMIIKSPGIKYDHPILLKYNNAKVINDIELSYHLAKDRGVKIIGITGTNGKTSTTTFVKRLLCANGYKAFSCGNIGVSPLGVLIENEEIDYLVMELSSFQLMGIDKFRCDYAFCLNLSPDHLNYHADLQEYYDAKLNIVKNSTYSNYFFLNENIDFKTNSLTLLKNDIDIDWLENMDTKGVSYDNVKLVYQFCKTINLDPDKIVELFNGSYKTLEHRMEFIGTFNGIKYINDSKATNVEATKLALSQLKRITLILGGFDKGEDLTELKDYLGNVINVVAYGQNQNQFDFIENIKKVRTLKEAFLIAEEISASGDVVLLSPASASYDQFKNYEHRGNEFKKLVLGSNK